MIEEIPERDDEIVALALARRKGPQIAHVGVYTDRNLIDVDASRNVRHFGKPIDKTDPKTIQLSRSIIEMGMLEPVSLLRRADGRYLLDTGFRRLCAADLAGITSIFSIVVGTENQESEVDRLQRVIEENERHEPLTVAELAFGCAAMRDAALLTGEHLTTRAIAARVGKSQKYVYDLLLCADNLIPVIMDAWKGTRGVDLPMAQAVLFAHMSAPDQAVEWEKYLGRVADLDAQSAWRGHRARVSRGAKKAEIEAAMRAAVHPQVRAVLAWVLDAKKNPCPIHYDPESVITSRNVTTESEHDMSNPIHAPSTPLVPGAWMQALGNAESFSQIDKMKERLDAYGSKLDLVDLENCRAALKRQEDYLEMKGIRRPELSEAEKAAKAAKEAAARKAKREALQAQLAEIDDD